MPATQAGRLKRSLIRPATMPTTPGCQAGPLTTSVACPCPACASAARSASSSIAASTSWRCRFTASSVAASDAASTGSSHSSSRRPRSASAIRPAALMRGPSAKPHVPAVGRSRDQRHVEQRRDAGTRAPRHHLQALADQRAIDAGQRHHVAHGGQRDEVEQADQVRLLARVEEALPAQRAHRRHRRQERDRRRRTAMTGRMCSPAGSD